MATSVEIDSPGPIRPDLSTEFDDSEFFNELDDENEAEQLLHVYNSPYDAEPTYNNAKSRRGPWYRTLKSKIPHYVPILEWMPKYKFREYLLRDVIAGLGVAAMLIPQSLAYASLAGLPAKYGLYTAFFPAVIYFMLGTSKQLSIGPDALSSLLVGMILSNNAVVGKLPTDVVTAFGFLVGSLLLGLGLIRVGFLDNILSRPLLSGFVNAVAVTIILEQIDTLTGINLGAIATASFPPDAVGTPIFEATVARAEEHGWRKVVAVLSNIRSIEWPAIIFGCSCIVILLGFRLLKHKFSDSKIKFLPETLLIVAGATVLTGTLRLDEKFSIDILGDVDSKMDPPRVPSFNIILSDSSGFFLNSAILVVVVGFIEHVVVAKVYADKHNYLVSPNREFVALGATNMVGSFFNCYPTFGSLPRSSLADSLGAVSQFFSLVSAIVILLTILLMGPLFYYLPRVVMSAIIIVASLGLFEFHDIVFLYQLRAWTDLGLLTLTFGLTVGLGIELGIFASLGISILQLIRHTTYPPVTILGHLEGTTSYVEVRSSKEHKDNELNLKDKVKLIPGVLIVRIEEPLYFANIAQIKRLFSRIEQFGDPRERSKAAARRSRRSFEESSSSSSAAEAAPGEVPTYAIVIHSRNITSMDASSVQALKEMVNAYKQRRIHVCFVKVRPQLREKFIRSQIVPQGREDTMLFKSTHEAVQYCLTTSTLLDRNPAPAEDVEENQRKQERIDALAESLQEKPTADDLIDAELQ